MKSLTEHLVMNIPSRRGFENITHEVERIVRASGVREVVVSITAGKLDLGPWEQIFYGEFDGRRDKRVLVKVIGE